MKNIRIGIAGPVTLSLLNLERRWDEMPKGYNFPMISYFVNYLTKQGYKVTIYSTSRELKKCVVYKDSRLIICIAPQIGYTSILDFYFRQIKVIKKMMVEHPVNVINANWSYEFALAALQTRIPTVVTLHDYAKEIFKIYKSPVKFVRLILNYFTLKKAKKLVAVSPYILNTLTQKEQIKTSVVPNYYDKSIELNSEVVKKNYIVTVCSGFDKRKNLKTALTAFNLYKTRNPDSDIKYSLIGHDTQKGGNVWLYIMQNFNIEHFIFNGPLEFEKVIQIVSQAKIMIHPSLEESFGMSVLESMVLKTPVIGGEKSGNIPYLLANNRGYLCDVTDSKSIAITFENALNEDNCKIVNSAYNYAKSNFRTEIVIPQILKILEKHAEKNH